MMGRRAYRTSATMAVVAPMPPMKGRGMRNPKRARLGTVWNTFATPSTGPRHAGRRVSRIPNGTRSEEHTSELQSLAYLVCRLLLEKKKKKEKRIKIRSEQERRDM